MNIKKNGKVSLVELTHIFKRRTIKFGLTAKIFNRSLYPNSSSSPFKCVGISQKFSLKLVSPYYKYRTSIYVYQCILYALSPSNFFSLIRVWLEVLIWVFNLNFLDLGHSRSSRNDLASLFSTMTVDLEWVYYEFLKWNFFTYRISITLKDDIRKLIIFIGEHFEMVLHRSLWFAKWANHTNGEF
jgi:hypothetical protein